MATIKQQEWNEVNLVPLSYFEMLVLVGQVLLALRHPENAGESTGVARELISKMAASIHERFPAGIPAELIAEWREEGLIE
jgi:PHD/YefM family antitoxin component YafN of YafNO toxin-antitoxin module